MTNEGRGVEEKTSALESPWVWGFMVFMGVVLAANGALVYFAYKTKPSMVVSDYYERGKDHESRAKAADLMKKDLGWGFKLAVPSEIQVAKATQFNVTITGGEGAPSPDNVTLYAYRPSDAAYDFSAPMAMSGAGVFIGEVVFPLPGKWDVIIEARKGNAFVSTAKRLVVGDGQRRER